MRIAVIGAQGTGKTTFIQDFIERWPMYKTSERTYRDSVKENTDLKVNRDGNKETQTIIRESLVAEIKQYSKDDNVILNRSILDNLVYTLYLAHYETGDIDSEFVRKGFEVMKETMQLYDLVFFIPITEKYDIPIEEIAEGDNELRDLDKTYQQEIDALFKSLVAQHERNNSAIFPFHEVAGCPAFIEIFGDRETRVQMAGLYVTDEGGVFGETDSLMNDLVQQAPKGVLVPKKDQLKDALGLTPQNPAGNDEIIMPPSYE